MTKVYLGDSVYAEWKDSAFGMTLVLITDNGLGPTNTIVLDESTRRALKKFIADEEGY